jgi:hypothetical protein
MNGQPYALVASYGKALSLAIEEEAGRVPEPVWTLWRIEKFRVPVGNRNTVPQTSSP